MAFSLIFAATQANIKNPRSLEEKFDKAVESFKSGIKGLFGKKNK